MGSKECQDEVTTERVVQARARNISHNMRCTECGSQSIEDSQADKEILLRKSAFSMPEVVEPFSRQRAIRHIEKV